MVTGFGVDTDVFRYRAGSAPGAPTFVYPGTYSERHGADIFAAALGLLLDERPGGARLDFYGTGTDARKILDACPERHRHAIAFHAPVAADRIAQIMSAATAGLASVKPGENYDYAFATKALALMATGCPVVYAGPGPAAGVVDEVSRQHGAGRAVEFDVQAVADAMRNVLDNPLHAKGRQGLAEWIHEHHAARSVADRVAAHVLDALST